MADVCFLTYHLGLQPRSPSGLSIHPRLLVRARPSVQSVFSRRVWPAWIFSMQRPPSTELPLEHSRGPGNLARKASPPALRRPGLCQLPFPMPHPFLSSGAPPMAALPQHHLARRPHSGPQHHWPLGGTIITESPEGQTRLSSRSQRVATAVPTSQRRKLRLGDTKLRPPVAQLTTVRQGFDPCTLPSEFSAA